jgi:O-antigen ligase
LAWGLAALTGGLMIAFLPLEVSLLLFGGVALLLMAYLEPSLALILMLCLAPLKTLIETEMGWPLPLDIGQWAFGFYGAAWLVHQMVLKRCNIRIDPRQQPILWALGLFLLATSFSLWTAYDAGQVVRESLKWVQIGLLVVTVSYQSSRWDWIALGVVASASLQALVGLWQFQGGSGAAHLWILDYRFFRAFGSFGQPNPFGGFMGLVGPLALGLMLGYGLQAYRERATSVTTTALAVVYTGCTALLIFGLLTSWSRGAWLGFMGASAMVLWSFPVQRWLGNIAVLGGASLLFLLWGLGLLPASLTGRLTSFTQDLTNIQDVRGVVISDANYAVVERLAHWQAAIGMAEASPWLGIGFGNYELAYPDFDLINWPFALGHAHNYYLNLWAETGIIGLVSYLVLWACVIAVTLRLLYLPDLTWPERGLAAGLSGTWTHLSIHSLLDNLYVNNLFLHIGVMMGLVAALHLIRMAHRDGFLHF